jgi:ATPase subunit of ABC transporter with duplicated ATPase domains
LETSAAMAAQYSFVMKGMTKTFPGAPKPILNNIHLQFYSDAKIAIIGPNGSGKSTLMKIMAGRDKEYVGEAWPGEGIRVGYLEQEPQLDPAKTVKENVMDGVRPVADMMDRFKEIGRRETPGGTHEIAAREAGYLAARRADEPSRCRERRLAGKASRRLSG